MSNPNVGVQVQGAAQLRRTLKAAGDDMGDLKELHREVGGVVLPVARSGTPYGSGKGGHIQTTVRLGATKTAAVIRAGNKSKPYGPPIHWGWFRRNIKPNPWLTEAAQKTEPTWFARYFAGIETIIGKIKGKDA